MHFLVMGPEEHLVLLFFNFRVPLSFHRLDISLKDLSAPILWPQSTVQISNRIQAIFISRVLVRVKVLIFLGVQRLSLELCLKLFKRISLIFPAHYFLLLECQGLSWHAFGSSCHYKMLVRQIDVNWQKTLESFSYEGISN